MGIFGNILRKLGIGDGDGDGPKPTPTPRPTGTAPMPSPRPTTSPIPPAGQGGVAVAPPPPKAVAVVAVVAQLEQRAAATPQDLNWRTSIVDLLKLLDIDSSLSARKELAEELGCPPELMGDSAKMNMWLHKTVLERIAANGGNVPKELLD